MYQPEHTAAVEGAEQFIARAARCLAAGVRPEDIAWRFEPSRDVRVLLPLRPLGLATQHAVLIRQSLMNLVWDVCLHAEETRFDTLYELLWHAIHDWRTPHEEQPAYAEALRLRHSVRRELRQLAGRPPRVAVARGQQWKAIGCDALNLLEESLARARLKSDAGTWLLLGRHATILSATCGLCAAAPVRTFAGKPFTTYWAPDDWHTAVDEALALFDAMPDAAASPVATASPLPA